MESDEMARRDPAHAEVAAYALGVLDPGDAERYERHLAGCVDCASELELLLPVSRLLADADLASVRAMTVANPPAAAPAEPATVGPPTVVRPVLSPELAARPGPSLVWRQLRFPFPLAARAAVTAAAAGFALFAGASLLAAAPDGPSTLGPPTVTSPVVGMGGLGGSDLGEGERHSATDPATGVRVEAVLTDWEWGTSVSFALWSLPGPCDCQLVLVYEDGTTEVTGSWWVPPDGYGTPEQPEPFTLRAAADGSRDELVELQVNEVLADGTRTLVTVPL
jgi:hypothetical protein